MAKKTKEDAEKTRLALLDSALEVISQNGLVKTTLNQIAIHAGVSRGAIYWHFEDKNALITALWEEQLKPQHQLMQQIGSSDAAEIPAKMLHIAHSLFSQLLHNHKLQTLAKLSMQASSDISFSNAIKAEHKKDLVLLEAAFQNVKDAQLLQPHLTVKSAALFYNAIFSGFFYEWELQQGAISIEMVEPLLLSMKKGLFIESISH